MASTNAQISEDLLQKYMNVITSDVVSARRSLDNTPLQWFSRITA